MTMAADYQLRDLIERLDRCERSVTDEAAAVLHELRFQNEGDVMSESPVFVAEFGDGQVTRMTVFTSLKKLDVERSVRLARCAYYSRKRQEPPPIVKARFEQDGKVLEAFSSVDLEDIEDKPIEDFDVKALLAERRQADEDARKAYLLEMHADDASGEPPL